MPLGVINCGILLFVCLATQALISWQTASEAEKATSKRSPLKFPRIASRYTRRMGYTSFSHRAFASWSGFFPLGSVARIIHMITDAARESARLVTDRCNTLAISAAVVPLAPIHVIDNAIAMLNGEKMEFSSIAPTCFNKPMAKALKDWAVDWRSTSLGLFMA